MARPQLIVLRIVHQRRGVGLPRHARHGERVTGSWFSFYHYGWHTLASRLAKVDFYTSRDPSYELNDGIAYDRALLFGYERDAVDDLLSEYERRRARLGQTGIGASRACAVAGWGHRSQNPRYGRNPPGSN